MRNGKIPASSNQQLPLALSPLGRAMLLTAPGSGAIAVVRLAGAGVEAFLQGHFSRAVEARKCVHGKLRDGDRVIDDPVVVRVGPQAVDLNLHGGPWVVRAALELARREGFEVIETASAPAPLEAVDGRTLLECEMLSHLPLARTEPAVRALLHQPRAWEEFESRPAAEQRESLPSIIEDRALWWMLHPPRVAILGPANVGKSTLANQLFGQDRSIVADLPGTTRDWVGELADLDGLPVMLVDTPGVRITADSIEREAIERGGGEVERADLVLLVLDASAPLSSEEHWLRQRYPEALIVANKSDRGFAWPGEAGSVLRTSATNGTGIDLLRRRIAGYFGCDALDEPRPMWWTPHQREQLFERCAKKGPPPSE